MRLVEIEFRGRRRAVYANPEDYPLTAEDAVIVQADRGIDLGYVNLADERFAEYHENALENGSDPEAVIRLATRDDFEQSEQNAELELEARGFFREEVRRLELEMKLVEVECQLDRRKLTFYFTADGRVDFRELVKSLAQKFHTRIDLRQIGARDESKRLGGIGICGRELCCASWIREFKPVTTSMMKDQHMILNPQKNTGPCGKLRCCLRYEVEQYRDLNRLFPRVGTQVKGPRGRGRVTKFSYNWEHIGIEWEDGAKFSYGEEHLAECTDWNPENAAKTQLITFKTDPSQEIQRKDELEGELVARGTPREGQDPRVSVRSSPKKGGGGDSGTCENCGKSKSDKHGHGDSGPGKQLAEMSEQTAQQTSEGDATSEESKPSRKKSRRGGSRRRGRGRGKSRDSQGTQDEQRQGGERRGKPRTSKPNNQQAKPKGGDPQQTGDTASGDSSEGNRKKSSRRRGGRNRGRRKGGGGENQGQGGGNPNKGGGPPSSGGETGPSRSSGAGDDQGTSSQPAEGTRSEGRPPRSRGRNRKR